MYVIPFHPNAPDNTHCFQACLKMVLGTFLPEREFTLGELDAMSGKLPELWSGKMQGVISLHEMGFEVIDWDTFDLDRFIEIGEDYILERYGKEIGAIQLRYSDVAGDRILAKDYRTSGLHRLGAPTIEDCRVLLDDGFLIICEVNAPLLREKAGYSGHFILLIGYDDLGFLFHDPGLPGEANRHVSFEIFSKAWAYPDESMRNVMAVRLQQ